MVKLEFDLLDLSVANCLMFLVISGSCKVTKIKGHERGYTAPATEKHQEKARLERQNVLLNVWNVGIISVVLRAFWID